MKRMHIHVGVENIDQSVNFYNALFGAEPAKVKSDYAKWMLDDPRINFAISTRVAAGVDHLGMQVEEDNELEELRDRLRNADTLLFDEGEDVCCYARSEKSWAKDPSGVAWEAYKTMQDAQTFSNNQPTDGSDCCVPEMASNLESARDENGTSASAAKQNSGCCG